MTSVTDDTSTIDYDAIIVGAGLAGLSAVHRLKTAGLSVRAFDNAESVGGTWHWNKYPGARVDIESAEYSLPLPELQKEWRWSEKYSPQDDVLRYMNWVADRLELRPHIQLSTTITSAHFDEATETWKITAKSDQSGSQTLRSRYFVLAAGYLSLPHLPNIPGIDSFKGTIAHTARWPEKGVDLEGKRIGLIGTSASGVQIVQTTAPLASQLTVFQRTANWSFPLNNKPMSDEYWEYIQSNYTDIRHHEHTSRGPGAVLVDHRIEVSEDRSALEISRDELFAEFEAKWKAGGPHLSRSFPDIITSMEANDALREFWTKKIYELVHDPETARKLTPTHPPLSRRPPGNSGYYETYNRDNVALVDVKEDPIERITESGILLKSGAHHELDVLVLATGFDAGTGTAMKIDLRGRGGLRIQDHWSEGVRTHLGLSIHGFPNLMMVNGPQSPVVHFSPPLLATYQADLIVRIIEMLDGQGRLLDTPQDAEELWTEEIRVRYEATLIPKTDSWWMGANIPGKPRRPIAFPGGFTRYREFVEDWLSRYTAGNTEATFRPDQSIARVPVTATAAGL